MRVAAIILVAFCVTFSIAATASAGPNRVDYVTAGLLCIHQHEGAWNDTGAPYWGGLQMDYSFQWTYGHDSQHGSGQFVRRWGTADHWPVWAQIQAGKNGYRARGWYPWPNTARICGLL